MRSGRRSKPLELQPLGQEIDEEMRLGRRYRAGWKHCTHGRSRCLEIREHDFESLLVDEIADLPERTISDTDAMTSGSMRGRGAVGAKTAIHLYGGQAAVDPKPPNIGFALSSPAQDALMIGKIAGLARAAVALEIIGRES
jgi:hypothetical protein